VHARGRTKFPREGGDITHDRNALQALLTSTLLVAAAEIGDKTQLLSFMLASRFPGRAWPVIGGIALATLANHALASAFGVGIAAWIAPRTLRWVLALTFFAFAIWALIPDRVQALQPARRASGPFVLTTALFFLAEMGDKTQLATVALAAQYQALTPIVIGTTLGMLIANVPAVLLGERLTHILPLRWFRILAAVLFALFGLAVLLIGQA
jgi:Ca2+/H+ antiporter, TMEM165/GDT1 family